MKLAEEEKTTHRGRIIDIISPKYPYDQTETMLKDAEKIYQFIVGENGKAKKRK
jgi:hypothetical protein